MSHRDLRTGSVSWWTACGRAVCPRRAGGSTSGRRPAPSDALRRWFGHDPKKWTGFKRRYRQELRSKIQEMRRLAEQARRGTITLVYGARDEQHNNAVVLKEILRKLS